MRGIEADWGMQMNAQPDMQTKDSRFDRGIRLAIVVALFLPLLIFVGGLLQPLYSRWFPKPSMDITCYVALMPPPGKTATASWDGGTGQLPLLFRYKHPEKEGNWHCAVEERVQVHDAEGNLLVPYGPCPGFDCEGGMEQVSPPPLRWYQFGKKLAQRRTLYANYFSVYRCDQPNSHPDLSLNDRNLVDVKDALPLPEGFLVEVKRDSFIDAMMKKTVADVEAGKYR